MHSTNADLRGASGIDAGYVDLSAADLTGADLSGVDLSGGGDMTVVAPAGATCTAQSGPLHLSVALPRTTGISPFLAFFDATATTDSAVTTTVTQNVTFTWSFGDGGASGTGKWAYGSNPGANSMNAGSGIVASHLYRTVGKDTQYNATVIATDGTNTASCAVGVTAYDPGGKNGFPGVATTCVSSSTTPAAGAGGCPSGASVLKTSSVDAALKSAYGDGKRVLFKCGDTFSGDNGGNDNLTAVKWAIGAYGGCEDTQTGRPIFSNSGDNQIFEFSNTNGEGTLSDFDCEGHTTVYGGCIWGNDSGKNTMYEVTMYNIFSNNEQESFGWNQCSQCGLVQVYQNNVVGDDTEIGTYVSLAAFSNYPLTGNLYNDTKYQAILGSHFDDGTANYKNNAETFRVFGCQGCNIANNDFLNAGPAYAQLKMHAGGKSSTWPGQYTENVEIADNYFAGTSGANSIEIAPQADDTDERLRDIVIERNVFWQSVALSGRQLLISGINITARDNAFYLATDSSYGIQVCQRGIEPAPTGVEGYNNSFYAASGAYSGAAIDLTSDCDAGNTDPSNSYFKNNLGYFPGNQGGTIPIVQNGKGANNTIANNTSSTLSNPSWTNASGTFKKITDWKPTANDAGGVSVPVVYDALGTKWSPTWSLGAVHP